MSNKQALINAVRSVFQWRTVQDPPSLSDAGEVLPIPVQIQARMCIIFRRELGPYSILVFSSFTVPKSVGFTTSRPS